ncbi:MAG: hypothetical protein APF78_01850 [Sphingomonadales bacterium BRH_c3]|nr:MAG: hypothetical protein APF78_01850 [Sphingomonadales bacterium BRH_c3]
MDAFEKLAADIFWDEGYWVRTGVKVELTREEKIRIGRHSSPRWEIDLIAYRAATNELLALECKSYLDSGGVHAAHFLPGSKYAHRYKLFHDPVLRETVLERLRLQCVERGLCPADVTVRLGLIYGHVTRHNAPLLAEIFRKGDWLLFGPDWLRAHLGRMSAGSYENSTAAVVAKLLLRSREGAATGSRHGDDHPVAQFSEEEE